MLLGRSFPRTLVWANPESLKFRIQLKTNKKTPNKQKTNQNKPKTNKKNPKANPVWDHVHSGRTPACGVLEGALRAYTHISRWERRLLWKPLLLCTPNSFPLEAFSSIFAVLIGSVLTTRPTHLALYVLTTMGSSQTYPWNNVSAADG